jgi:nitrogen regulatory protein PII-like uncharacterized protein
MSTNLLEAIQIQMGYPALQKVDPNTQEVKTNNNTPDKHRFSQAAIPAVLTALYKYSRTDEGATHILEGDAPESWTDLVFADNKENVIQKILDYSFYTNENAVAKMNTIAENAVTIIREKLSGKANIHDAKKILSDQRDHILLYLLPVLQIGEMLHDNTFDDRTNKMEGPASSLMHAIGGKFSDN